MMLIMKEQVNEMFRFALKNMAIKRVQVILIVISIVISAGVAVLAYNTASQVSDGITNTAGYYSAIIGPTGSKTQLAMNTMYFTDEPLGTISYELCYQLQQDSRVRNVIPFAMADSYNGYNVVGTTSDYISGKELKDGEMFDDGEIYQVVLGYTVAKVNQLSVGDTIYTSHSVGETHTQPFTVVGILEETHSAYDRIVFTEFKTIWAVHESEEEHEEEHEEEEEHDHEDMNGMVCAFLVSTVNPTDAMTLVNEYDGQIFVDSDKISYVLQAIEPMDTVRSVLEETNSTKYIVYMLCAIILVMNIIIITIITLLNMHISKKEISLMRLIGISMKKINLLYIIQNGIIGLISVIFAFIVSRGCLYLMDDFVSSMGVVLNMTKVYPIEWAILAGVFVIAVLPTVIWTFAMSKKDGMED